MVLRDLFSSVGPASMSRSSQEPSRRACWHLESAVVGLALIVQLLIKLLVYSRHHYDQEDVDSEAMQSIGICARLHVAEF